MRPAYRAWVESLARALTNPVAIIGLLALPKDQAERALGGRATEASRAFDAALRQTLSPAQVACVQANQERQARQARR